MAYRFLPDENMEPKTLHRLKSTTTTSSTSIPSRNSDEPRQIRQLQPILRTQRVIVTFDDDFIIEHDESDYYGAIYFEDVKLSATNVADVVHEITTVYPESAFRGLEFGGREWL